MRTSGVEALEEVARRDAIRFDCSKDALNQSLQLGLALRRQLVCAQSRVLCGLAFFLAHFFEHVLVDVEFDSLVPDGLQNFAESSVADTRHWG
jgi:hypothetical protein